MLLPKNDKAHPACQSLELMWHAQGTRRARISTRRITEGSVQCWASPYAAAFAIAALSRNGAIVFRSV